MKCLKIIDFYNKKIINPTDKMANLINSNNHHSYIHDYIKNHLNNHLNYQNKIHMYIFDNNEKYYGLLLDKFNKNKLIIEKANNPVHVSLLWALHGEKMNKKDRINSILKKVKYLSKNNIHNTYNTQNTQNFDKEKTINLLNNLNDFNNNFNNDFGINNYNNSNKLDKFNNQKGGFLIWLFQKGINKLVSSWLSFVFDMILDIIDVILVIAITIPGSTSFPGDNILLITSSIVFSILRLDIIGIISGIIRFIPSIGKLLGGLLFMGSKIGKYAYKFMNYDKYKQTINEATQFGYKYGYNSNYENIINFVSEYPKAGMIIVLTARNYGVDVIDEKSLLKEYPDINMKKVYEIAKESLKYDEKIIDIVRMTIILKDKIIYYMKKGNNLAKNKVNKNVEEKANIYMNNPRYLDEKDLFPESWQD